MNPKLKTALVACKHSIAEGYHYNALNFVYGVLYRFPEDDLTLFQYCRHDTFFRHPPKEGRVGIDIWDEVDPYLFRDVNAGWVLSKTAAELIMDRIIHLKADAVRPYQNRYYDPTMNFPFQLAFEKRVQENLAKHASNFETP